MGRNRGAYLLFVSVVAVSLGGCAVGTEGEEPRQEMGKTARSGTIDVPNAANADEAQPETVRPFYDQSDRVIVADNPFGVKDPGPPAPDTVLPTPKPPGTPH